MAVPVDRPGLPQGPFLVCGLARSGQAVARLLAERGEEVLAVDSAAPEGAAGLADAGVEVHLDAAGDDLVERVNTLVKSPGVPSWAPAVEAARRHGVSVVGELEIGWRLTSAPVIAVTGTNGKTTVTEMIGHAMRTAGRTTAVVGNVGRAISDIALAGESPEQIVVEASSFQLEDSSLFAPEVAVLLNLSPDHLDRHGSFDAYRSAKLRIFANQEQDGVAVVPSGGAFDDRQGAARALTFGEPGADAAVAGGAVAWHGEEVLPAGALPIPGHHNLVNAAAALAACVAAGVAPDAAGAALAEFPGVPHRLEEVAIARGVRWVNDSKATNVGSTLTALSALDAPVRLILGGVAKDQDFAPLASPVAERCTAVHLIGEAADEIASALSTSGIGLSVDSTLEAAVEGAAAACLPGETVLLSPACASFDQFTDFEERGRRFTELAREVAAR